MPQAAGVSARVRTMNGQSRLGRLFVTGIAGLAAILFVVLADVRSSEAAGSNGVWNSSCSTNRVAPDDPIVFPAQPGASHMHLFFGARGVDAFSTAHSVDSTDNSCRVGNIGSAAYWFPALYADGELFLPGRVNNYYRNWHDSDVELSPYPQGLRIVAAEAQWYCGGRSAVDSPQGGCANGSDDFRMIVFFPDCWDGSRIDSPNHSDHMAYQQQGRCPASHPVAVPRLELVLNWFWDDLPDGTGPTSKLELASGGLDSGHADLLNTWDPDALGRIVEQCLNRSRQCSANEIPEGPAAPTPVADGLETYGGGPQHHPSPDPDSETDRREAAHDPGNEHPTTTTALDQSSDPIDTSAAQTTVAQPASSTELQPNDQLKSDSYTASSTGINPTPAPPTTAGSGIAVSSGPDQVRLIPSADQQSEALPTRSQLDKSLGGPAAAPMRTETTGGAGPEAETAGAALRSPNPTGSLSWSAGIGVFATLGAGLTGGLMFHRRMRAI